jgi:NAD(P)-dependent dehydrogenase (short-subunit alcohol dehydrogenase family)
MQAYGQRLRPEEDTTGEHDSTVAVVLGASSGIGRASALMLAAEGALVAVGAVDEGGVDAVVAEIGTQGGRAEPLVVDVTDPAGLRSAVEAFARTAGGINALVYSAGIQRYGTVTETTDELWAEVFAVNVTGAFVAVRACMPHLRASGRGSVVVVSSVQSVATQQNVVAYTASKGALNAFVRAVAVDEAVHGVRVNAVLPGSVDTPMLRASAALFARPRQPTDDVLAEWGSGHAIGRVARPEEIANVISFLAGPRSSFVTGGEYRVDGGLLARLAAALPNTPERKD